MVYEDTSAFAESINADQADFQGLVSNDTLEFDNCLSFRPYTVMLGAQSFDVDSPLNIAECIISWWC